MMKVSDYLESGHLRIEGYFLTSISEASLQGLQIYPYSKAKMVVNDITELVPVDLVSVRLWQVTAE